MTSNHSNNETGCPRQAWVLEALALEEAIAGSARATELEKHLSKCTACNTLARKVGSVTAGLAGLALLGPRENLYGKASAQVSHALQTGGQFTGRVDIPAGPDGALRHMLPWTKITVFTIATVVIIAFGTLWLSGYQRANEPVDQIGHSSPEKNLESVIQNPWSAFGHRSTKDIDRAADIEPPANLQKKLSTKSDNTQTKITDPNKTGSTNPPPNRK